MEMFLNINHIKTTFWKFWKTDFKTICHTRLVCLIWVFLDLRENSIKEPTTSEAM